MTNRYIFEALGRTLRDIMENDLPFRGRVMILEGDFRQVLHVVSKGTKHQLINTYLNKSLLWRSVWILRLIQTMRSLHDKDFSNFILWVGDGFKQAINDDFIYILTQLVIPWEAEQSINNLIDATFLNLLESIEDVDYFISHAISTPTNAEVDRLNEIII